MSVVETKTGDVEADFLGEVSTAASGNLHAFAQQHASAAPEPVKGASTTNSQYRCKTDRCNSIDVCTA